MKWPKHLWPVSQKELLVRLYGLELKGVDINFAFSGDRLVLYDVEDGKAHVLYAVPMPSNQYIALFADHIMTLGSRNMGEVSLSRAAEIIKMTWKKRASPPRIDPILRLLIAVIGMVGLLELVFVSALLVIKALS